MNITNQIRKGLLYNLNNSFNLLYSFRYLENDNNQTISNNKKRQLIELYIILAILAAIIIIILGGYAIYRKYEEKQLLQEIEREDQYLMNIENSSKSSSQEEFQVYSFNNGVVPKKIESKIGSENIHNNSFDYDHEERMERIRKKYGNVMLIKNFLKKKLENVIFNNILKEQYGDNCTICLNNFLNNIVIYKTPCEHIFHKECFNKYLKNIKKDKLICPNCNQNLIINKKFLKLRVKSQKIKIKTKEINSIEINLDKNKNESKEIKKNFNEITSKKIEINDNNFINSKEAIIIIKKRKEKNDYNYNPIKDIKYKDTEILKNKDFENNNDNDLFRKIKDNKNNETINFENFESEKNEINNIKIKKKDTNNNLNNKNHLNEENKNNNIYFSSNELNTRNNFIINK